MGEVNHQEGQGQVVPDLSYIAESLRALAVPIDMLAPDPANARTGHAVDRIAASLHHYGQRKPLVVNRNQHNKIEAGNGTWLAAKQLGWSHIAAVFVDDDASTAAAFGIADNRTGEMSQWDTDALLALVPTLGDLPTGFAQAELDDLLLHVGAPPSLDDLAEAHGEPDERDFWPIIRVQVAPDTMDRWQTFMDAMPGPDDAAKVAHLLACVDAEALENWQDLAPVG